MESFERARLDAYFAKIAAQFAPDEQAATFLVTHLLTERPGFVRSVASLSRLRAVLPKPNSISRAAQQEIALYGAMFDRLQQEAVYGHDTRKLVAGTLATL